MADSEQPPEETIESQLASILWQWKFADIEERDALIADSKLVTLIEFWFPFSEIEFTRHRGIWCDGIPLVEITAIDRTTFRITGVGYFPFQLAPFELEFSFAKRRDVIPRAIILRLGNIANECHQSVNGNKHPQNILDSRPTANSDWAVAVELTDTDHESAE